MSPDLSASVRSVRSRQGPALAVLTAGGSVKAAAAASNVNPRSVRRWLLEPDFADQLVEGQEAALGQARSRLRALTDRAVDVLEAALEAGDVGAARTLLEGIGLLGKRVNLQLTGDRAYQVPLAPDLTRVFPEPAELETYFAFDRRLAAAFRGALSPMHEHEAVGPVPPSMEAEQEDEDLIEQPPSDPITAAARRFHRRHTG